MSIPASASPTTWSRSIESMPADATRVRSRRRSTDGRRRRRRRPGPPPWSPAARRPPGPARRPPRRADRRAVQLPRAAHGVRSVPLPAADHDLRRRARAGTAGVRSGGRAARETSGSGDPRAGDRDPPGQPGRPPGCADEHVGGVHHRAWRPAVPSAAGASPAVRSATPSADRDSSPKATWTACATASWTSGGAGRARWVRRRSRSVPGPVPTWASPHCSTHGPAARVPGGSPPGDDDGTGGLIRSG